MAGLLMTPVPVHVPGPGMVVSEFMIPAPFTHSISFPGVSMQPFYPPISVFVTGGDMMTSGSNYSSGSDSDSSYSSNTSSTFSLLPSPTPITPLSFVGSGSDVSSAPTSPGPVPASPNVEMRPGITACIIDCGTTFWCNGEEMPYVSNVWDANRPRKFASPPPELAYYVPPSVDDLDYFGGQQYLWQEAFIKWFGRFGQDIWRMQAVPDFRRGDRDGWLGFTVTTKLRFCCRECNTPWTSKQGKIVFGFILDKSLHRGYIFMKIFGQICMKKRGQNCNDWSYQTPACYPEEIEWAVLKLSEFMGYTYYGLPMSQGIFQDCSKSIRAVATTGSGSGGRKNAPKENESAPAETHHRRDLCQACQKGVCRAVAVAVPQPEPQPQPPAPFVVWLAPA